MPGNACCSTRKDRGGRSRCGCEQDGTDLLARPYRERRRILEDLFDTHQLSPPWTLCPMTTDLAKAREWLETWTDVSGVEGILVKGMNQRYLPGSRAWYKIRRRDTTEAIIGAITSALARPSSSSSAAMTTTAASAPLAGRYRCARTRPSRSPSTSPLPARNIPGPG
ncbi:hypothetical protein ACIPUC_00115 [Streptomyces sp. LARHCF249]